MKLIKKVLRLDFVMAFGLRVFGAFALLTMNLALARLMTPEGYGGVAFALSWVGLVMLVGNLGFKTGAMRFVAGYIEISNYAALQAFIRMATIWTLAFSALMMALLVAFGTLSSTTWLGDDLMLSLALVAPLAFLLPVIDLFAGIQRGAGAIAEALVPYSVVYPIVTLLGICVIWMSGIEANLKVTILALVLGASVALLFASINLRRFLASLVKTTIGKAEIAQNRRHWLRASLSTLPTTLSVQAPRQLDTIILGFLISTQDLGVYFFVNRLVRLTSFGLQAAHIVISPRFAAGMELARSTGDPTLALAENRDKMQSLSRHGIVAAAGLALPLILFLTLFGPWILSWVGPEFVQKGRMVLLILLLGEAVNVFCGTNAAFMNMTGLERRLAKLSTLFVIVHLVCIPLGAWIAGLLGAAVAASAVTIARNCTISLVAWQLRRIDTTVLALLHR